jgi:tetratricopeptide (TPR) repeat protein
VAFDKYYDVNLYPTENWFDRAHNFYLDILSMSGVVGFAGYILFLLVFFFILFKTYRKKEFHYLEFILIVSFFIAYLVQNAVLFDTPVSFLVLFVLLGYIAIHEVRLPQEVGLHEMESFSTKNAKNGNIPLAVPVVVLLPFLFLSYQAVLKPYMAGTLTSQAASQENQNVENIRSGFEKAFSYNSFGKIEIMEQLVNKAEKMEVLEYDEENIDKYREFVLNFAAPKTKEISNSPVSGLRERFNLLRMYWVAGFFDNDYYRKGEEIGDKVLEEFPTKVPLYAFVGRFKLKNYNTEGALQMYEKLLAVSPNAPESHWDLGLAYLENDIFGEADFEIRQALDMGYDPTEEQLLYVAQNFAVKNQFLWSLPYYEKLVKINPEVPKYWLALAILYKEVNFIPEARDAITKFVDLDPTQKPLTDQFLKELK